MSTSVDVRRQTSLLQRPMELNGQRQLLGTWATQHISAVIDVFAQNTA